MQKTTKVTFELPAEIVAGASTGLLLGEFNNWDREQAVTLKRGRDGSMKTTLQLESGRRYAYRYLLDGGRWVNDLKATEYSAVQEFGVQNCVVHVPEPAVRTKTASTVSKAAAVDAGATRKPSKSAAAKEEAKPASAKKTAKASRR